MISNPLATRRGRLATFSLLYVSEGIPFGFSAIALVAYLRNQGVGLGEIGLYTAWLYAPWTLKWAWAPLVDLIRPQRLGPRRAWIAGSHIMMILTMATLLVFDPGANLTLLIAIMVTHNVFAATQDVAIDALAVDVLEEDERGVANGFMFAGSTLGQAIGGAGALYITDAFGFGWSYAVVLGALAIVLFTVSLRIRETTRVPGPTSVPGAATPWRRFREFLVETYRAFFRSGRGPILGILFALLPSGAVALGLALGTTLQVDLGMNDKQIADLTLFCTLAGATGSVIGGWISDRVGHRRTLVIFYALTIIPTLWLARQFTGEGMAGVTPAEFYGASIVYSFCSGLLNGTYIAIFMGLTSLRIAATQFTAYMAMGNAAYAWSSAWQGKVAASHGYAAVFVIDSLIVLVPMVLAPFLAPSTRGRHRGDTAGPAPVGMDVPR